MGRRRNGDGSSLFELLEFILLSSRAEGLSGQYTSSIFRAGLWSHHRQVHVSKVPCRHPHLSDSQAGAGTVRQLDKRPEKMVTDRTARATNQAQKDDKAYVQVPQKPVVSFKGTTILSKAAQNMPINAVGRVQ
ncbi:hypothetical protein RRG08_011067 [Elysia crispata]|uniref:Uncharacterized protein n=1 Tax=Elysia crispata TaxID=231223 RepID=A0AAE0Z996_9GAST|nr:hypothetical protein RRG08_011067 [Elysia crispata]